MNAIPLTSTTATSAPPAWHTLAEEETVFSACYQAGLPLLLKGPTGCGKSRFVAHMAARLGRPLITVPCHDDTAAAVLMGRWLVRGGDTGWQDGPVTRAVRSGALPYLDELAEARTDVIVLLHPLTDHRRVLHVDGTDETLQAAEGFGLVASFNPGYQRGLKELKPSTRQRFVALSMGYPEAPVETEMIQGESGLDKGPARRLVRLGRELRGLDELGLAEPASTRLLVDAARLMVAGMAPRLAGRVAIAEPLSDDPEVIDAICDVIALAL